MPFFVAKIDRCPGIEQALQFAEVTGAGGLMEGGHVRKRLYFAFDFSIRAVSVLMYSAVPPLSSPMSSEIFFPSASSR